MKQEDREMLAGAALVLVAPMFALFLLLGFCLFLFLQGMVAVITWASAPTIPPIEQKRAGYVAEWNQRHAVERAEKAVASLEARIKACEDFDRVQIEQIDWLTAQARIAHRGCVHVPAGARPVSLRVSLGSGDQPYYDLVYPAVCSP